MGHTNPDRTPDDLAGIADRLRSERTIASATELDGIKLRAIKQASCAKTGQKGSLMRSRLALTMMIVFGLMLSTTGAGLAISGNSGNGDASEAQYEVADNGNENLGQEESGGGDPSPDEQVAVATGNDSLPFTGFFTIPLMVGGVAMLVTGAAMRRRTRD